MRSLSSAAAFSVNVNAMTLRGSTPGLRQDRRDPLGDDLRLARPGARDDLQRLVEAGDRLGLGRGVGRHAALSREPCRQTSKTFMTSSP